MELEQTAWVQGPVLLLMSCAILGQLLKLSVPHL